MSKSSINQYYVNLERAIQFSKSRNEDTVKSYFWMLLNEYAHTLNYEVAREVYVKGTKGKQVKPDGVLKTPFNLDIGCWESKDEKDDIDEEINAKQKKGYPFTNILFEDTRTAVLIQKGEEVMRVPVNEPEKLDRIIMEFINFKSEILTRFDEALEKFKEDIPTILETLRKKIDEASVKNKDFIAVSDSFLELCKAEINPDITAADIREMMIQHILTSDIFNKVFDDPEFHRHNNIANELEKLIAVLFTYSERKNLLGSIENFYDAINAAAASVSDHHEKQRFLKVLYENFYKVYNPKAADRLGVVYTPNEIVNFMIESTNHLLEKHFNKNLADKNVEILDPATGTGTFISSIIDSIPKKDLLYKYQNEIHANEVAILPYYVANLNVEFTFKQRMGYYEEFKNLCFVDTLENTDSLAYGGKQHYLFGLSSENSERIKRQNRKKISVIIGNPPYNATQQSENQRNKNRSYPQIDKRIKETYVKYSTTQNLIKIYDMYPRFIRWSSDRISEYGIISFITNNSYINSKTFDGFRKCIQVDFDYAYIIDLGGNIRELSGKDGIFLNEENTIFGVAAAVGIAMIFLVKKKSINKNNCQINYIHPCDIRATRKEKLDWLKENPFSAIEFNHISPDKKNNWINLSDNDFETLLPTALSEVRVNRNNNAIFKLYSLGINTARDEWVYDFNVEELEKKMIFFKDIYNSDVKKHVGKSPDEIITQLDYKIKWARELRRNAVRGIVSKANDKNITIASFRPFIKKFIFLAYEFIEMRYQIRNLFPNSQSFNKLLCFNVNPSKPFWLLATNSIPNLHYTNDSQCLPLYRYDANGNRIDNITDWGLEQFCKHYKLKQVKQEAGKTVALGSASDDQHKIETNPDDKYEEYAQPHLKRNRDNELHEPEVKYGIKAISKEDIFHYVYAVLHNPAYRKKYELNLKREFPRIPFYRDFWKWAKWGKTLMELHINYEKVKPFPLKEITVKEKPATKQSKVSNEVKEPEAIYAGKEKLKVKLKADKEDGVIEIDEATTLFGVPKEAWDYKLGNRSALEWVLDQYKEKKPSDPTIAEKFNTYRFADYKDHVIDLLKRVCTVSVETMKMISEMEKEQ